MHQDSENSSAECPICCKTFPPDTIQLHVNRCIFLNATNEDEIEKPKENKRTFSVFSKSSRSPTAENKKFKKSETISKATNASQSAASVHISDDDDVINDDLMAVPSTSAATKFASRKKATSTSATKSSGKSVPLAERMRPETIDDYIGQGHIMGKDTILRKILDKNETPSMILWGPPGVGKVQFYSIRLDKQMMKTKSHIFRQHWPISSPIDARRRKMFDL